MACPSKNNLKGSDSEGTVLKHENEKYGVKCCDGEIGHLQYNGLETKTHCSVPQREDGAMNNVKNHSSAVTTCYNYGQRLCTAFELNMNKPDGSKMCCGSGDSLQSEAIWISNGMLNCILFSLVCIIREKIVFYFYISEINFTCI